MGPGSRVNGLESVRVRTKTSDALLAGVRRQSWLIVSAGLLVATAIGLAVIQVLASPYAYSRVRIRSKGLTTAEGAVTTGSLSTPSPKATPTGRPRTRTTIEASGPESSESLDRQYIQTRWTEQEGLPQNSVNCILQTRDGYLWVGTFGGLARFDGVKFAVFNSANTPGMKANRILSLYEDRSGILWMGAETGEVMSLKGSEARTFTTADGLPGGLVRCFYEDQAGTLWIGTNGLVQWNSSGIKTYGERDGVAGSVWGIYGDRPDHLWLATVAGLVEFSNGRGTLHQSSGSVTALCPTSQGGLLVGGYRGLNLLDHEQLISYPATTGIPTQAIRALAKDRNGNIWIGYFEVGIISKWREGTPTRHLETVDLGTSPIGALCVDTEGNLWVGTRGAGLVRFKERKLTVYSTEDGLPSDGVNAIVDDGAGGIWSSTSNGLVHISGGSEPRFTTYTTRDGLPDGFVQGLYRAHDGALWLGAGGLLRFKDGAFTNYSSSAGLTNAAVHAITEDATGNLWVGTGVGLYDFRDGRFNSFHTSDGLVSDDVRFILVSRDRSLWLGTTGGLSHLQEGRFINYTTDSGLPNNYVRSIIEDEDGALWIGTYGGGICRFKDGRFVSVSTKDGLFDPFVSQIVDDEMGRVWMLSNHGIFHVDLTDLNDFADGRASAITCVSYGVADGMKSAEGNGGNQPAGWRAPDGRLWFATIKGLVAIDPAQGQATLPPTKIEDVLLDREALPSAQIVRIPPGKDYLEIHYTGLTFTRPDQVRFRYKLIGLDKDWIDAGTRRVAYYSHIPPGSYTFSVMSASSDGVWNPAAATLSVVVVPPFWRTWWFVTLLAAALAALLATVYWRRVEHLKRAREAQEAFSKQLLDSQEKERQRIAAELHDGLGQSLLIIKNRAFMASGALDNLEAAKEQLDEITDSASRAIDEVREIAFNLRPYQLNRFGLTRTLQAIFTRFSDPSRTVFSARIEPIDGLFEKDDEISIYRIIQEGINNIVKHSQATEANLTVKRSGGEVEFVISDNGRGFDPAFAPSAAGAKAGFGLTGLAERVRMLGGAHSLQSAPGRGTRITIKLTISVTISDGKRET